MAMTYGLVVGSGWETVCGDDRGTPVHTAFGAPSAPVHRLSIGDQNVLSIARHGDGHSIPPHAINTAQIFLRSCSSALRQSSA